MPRRRAFLILPVLFVVVGCAVIALAQSDAAPAAIGSPASNLIGEFEPSILSTPSPTPSPTALVEPQVAAAVAARPIPRSAAKPTAAATPEVATPRATSTPVPSTTTVPVSAASPPALSTPSLVDRGNAALAVIGYPWRQELPGWRIEFLAAEPGYRGLTFSGEQRIEIYVRPDDSDWDIARVTAHELGHAVDLVRNASADRARWLAQRDLDDTHWWPNSGTSDFASGAGDWAECFATWQTGSASLATGGACSASDLSVLAELA